MHPQKSHKCPVLAMRGRGDSLSHGEGYIRNFTMRPWDYLMEGGGILEKRGDQTKWKFHFDIDTMMIHPTMWFSHCLFFNWPLKNMLCNCSNFQFSIQAKIWWSHVLTVTPWDVSWFHGQPLCIISWWNDY